MIGRQKKSKTRNNDFSPIVLVQPFLAWRLHEDLLVLLLWPFLAFILGLEQHHGSGKGQLISKANFLVLI